MLIQKIKRRSVSNELDFKKRVPRNVYQDPWYTKWYTKCTLSDHKLGSYLLHSGMATPIAFATPVCAIAFSSKSWADANLLKGEMSARKACLSGCVGGGASALLACPSERVKVVLQNNPSVKSEPLNA